MRAHARELLSERGQVREGEGGGTVGDHAMQNINCKMQNKGARRKRLDPPESPRVCGCGCVGVRGDVYHDLDNGEDDLDNGEDDLDNGEDGYVYSALGSFQ